MDLRHPGIATAGLSLNSSTRAITGTPTTAGTYTFIGGAGGSVTFLVPGTGFYVTYPAHGQSGLTITVLPPVASVPISPWTLALVMVGLAGAGLLHWRQGGGPDRSQG